MASSLAYKNYQDWRKENPEEKAPDPVKGLSIEELYRLSEKEVG
jgi:hypothetical protein